MRYPSFVSVGPTSCVISLVLGLTPTLARSQSSAVVDEGTFTVTQKGAPLGRESFRIIRAPAPGGQVYLATGTSVLGDTKVTTRLGTDSTGVPVSYESDLIEKGEVVHRLRGRGRPGRLSALTQTKTGETAREYVLSNGALLMDEDVFHHFFFVPLTVGHAQLNVIAPRIGRQTRFQLEAKSEDTVDIAGRSIPARHFALTGPSGALREVWIDEKGRLLKVAEPERGLLALRDDPPR